MRLHSSAYPRRERPIPIKAILVGLPKSIEEKLTQQTAAANIEVVACKGADVEQITALLHQDDAGVVVIDSSEVWAVGLVRGLRAHRGDTHVLILTNASRLTGYIMYDYDRGIENAGEREILQAIEATVEDRPFRRRE